MSMCESELDMGIAGVMAAVLATKGAAWGMGIGIILHLLLVSVKNKQNETVEVKE